MLFGEKPKECELSRVQLQGLFKNTGLASSAVVEQVNRMMSPRLCRVGRNRALLAPSTSKSSLDPGYGKGVPFSALNFSG